MTPLLLAAIVATAAAAPAGGSFELHVESAAGAPNASEWLLRRPGGRTETVFLDSSPLLDESAIAFADVEAGPDGSPLIRLVLTSEGAGKLAQITMRHTGRRFGIVLDGELRAAPLVRGAVTDGVLFVTGSFTRAEASVLASKLAPPAAVAAPSAARGGPAAPLELQGTWSVLNTTMNGRLKNDSGSTFTFRESELILTKPGRGTERFLLEFELGPLQAFRLEPVTASKEGGGWMIFAREGDRLALAYYDHLERHPESFDPAPKKVILKLAREGSAEAATAPCAILEAAGLARLLPGALRQPDRERVTPGRACGFVDSSGQEVSLVVVPAAGQRVFERELEAERLNAPVQDEPELGPLAVSLSRGYHIRFVVLQREALVAFSFQIAGADAGTLRAFARRALAEIRD